MQIANPIYDVVFKYLMEDSKIAKLIISKIIGNEVLEIDFKPTEATTDIQSKGWTVYRLDFAARIKTDEGEVKHVLIEIQKAKFPTDIIRFRRYLGEQYASPENTTQNTSPRGKIYNEGIPIINIYFIGHTLEYTEVPVIKINREYIDVATGERITQKEAFIESLSHDSYVIQIPYLHKKRRTELEKVLSVFDQDLMDDSHHILNVSEEEFPEEYRIIIRRLQSAGSDAQVRKIMRVEDEILTELENQERCINQLNEKLDTKDKELESNKMELEAQAKMIEELMRKLEGK